MSTIHTFAGNPLDRGEAERRDEQWITTAAQNQQSLFLPFHKLQVLLNNSGNQPALAWVPGTNLGQLSSDATPILLGMRDETAHFAIAVPTPDTTSDYGEFVDCRMAAMSLPAADGGIIAQARAQLGWHRSHKYCSACGEPSNLGRGGQVRICPSCDTSHFPRTDPVAIMLIIDGDRCLLGQPKGPLVRTGMYSALAGFIDQGESIEEAVRREIMEEAGLQVGAVQYHSSQPWPFPSSLMIGCHGIAATNDINMDETEMHDVRWCDKQEVLDALDNNCETLKVPGSLAIAHHLIKAWAHDEIDQFS